MIRDRSGRAVELEGDGGGGGVVRGVENIWVLRDENT